MTRHDLPTTALTSADYAALKQAAQARAVLLRRQAINHAIDQVVNAVGGSLGRLRRKNASSTSRMLGA